MMSEPRHFGYLPDPFDARDRTLARRPGLTRVAEVRMDHLVTRIRNQGQTSSCVGHACVTGVELLHALEGRPVPNLSPAHAYWLGRAQDGFQDE
ncbi:MAG TPA: hypothetical protein VK509_10045, partial [Polyangiales bacterium]|nr:hypothetical protein [Polyangiales bacterium]